MAFRVLMAVLVVLMTSAAAGAQGAGFIKIHDGAHWIWYAREDQFAAHRADIEAMYDYADQAFEALENAWGMKPKLSRYSLLVDDKAGIAGCACKLARAITGKDDSDGIQIRYETFSNVVYSIKGYWATVYITHEMANLFTGILVSGGWPRDWWADDKSPFPYMTGVQIEFQLAPEIGLHHLGEIKPDDTQFAMFTHLKDRFGWEMFRRAFTMAIDDGINWDRFASNPSPLRTNYVAAYLEMGAREDLSSDMTGPVPSYDHKVVAKIIQAHQLWKAHPQESSESRADRDAFLSGNYQNVH